MVEPSKKSPEMEQALEESCKAQFGRGRIESIKNDICVICGKPAKEFRDELSKKEFTISGVCQDCQDATFGGGP